MREEEKGYKLSAKRKNKEGQAMFNVAGHKGQPKVVARQGRLGRRRRLKGQREWETLAQEKPSIFGMFQNVF